MKRIALMGLFGSLVLLCAAKPTTKWTRVKDAYRVHERLLNAAGAALGEYYEVQDGDVRAICYPAGKLVSLKTEQEGRAFVEKCEVWQ